MVRPRPTTRLQPALRHRPRRHPIAPATPGATLPQPFELLRLRSAHGGIVRARTDTGHLVADHAPASPDRADIVLARLPAFPHLGFLAATGPATMPLRIHPDPPCAPILSVRLLRTAGATTAALRHPLVERYAAALPPHPDEPAPPLMLDREADGPWEVFDLLAVSDDAPTLSPLVAEAFHRIASLVAPRLDAVVALAWLEQATPLQLAVCGEALLRLASPETLDTLGRAIVERPRLAEPIRAACRSDPFAETAITELAAWLPGRPQRPRIIVGPECDALAELAEPGRPIVELSLHLLAATRRHVRPRRDLAILTTARNEGPFLLDWIAHHRALGVDHAFVYSSEDNDDGSDTLLGLLADAGILTDLRNSIPQSVSRQRKAFAHAFVRLPELLDYRWVAVIDLDEYLMVDPGRFASLVDFLDLQEARGADAVALNWLIYGPELHEHYRDRPFAERLLKRQSASNPHVKTISRSNIMRATLHHAPIRPERTIGLTRDANGRPHHSPGLIGEQGNFRHHPDTGPAWVNHYFLRSLPEIVLKYARSSADHAGTHSPRLNADYVGGLLARARETLVDDRRILAFRDRVASERDALFRLPGVADAHAASVASYTALARRLVHDIPNHPDMVEPDHRADWLALVQASIARFAADPA